MRVWVRACERARLAALAEVKARDDTTAAEQREISNMSRDCSSLLEKAIDSVGEYPKEYLTDYPPESTPAMIASAATLFKTQWDAHCEKVDDLPWAERKQQYPIPTVGDYCRYWLALEAEEVTKPA